jgi:secreted trypsin-like serine protease
MRCRRCHAVARGHSAVSAALVVAAVHCNGADTEATSQVVSPIVGGTVVADGRHPGVGALVERDDGALSRPVCTGVLLDGAHVLTAAHCVAPAAAAAFGFVMSSRVDPGDAGSAVSLAAIALHPQFVSRPNGPSDELHDIAVLTLSRAVAPTPQSFSGTIDSPESGAPVVLVGFGSTLDASAPSSDTESDGLSRIESVSASEFVVSGSPAPRPCFGDSGGPAFSRDGSRLVGIASRAAVDTDLGCSQGAVFTRIDVHAAWIQSRLHEPTTPPSGLAGCEAGGRPSGGPARAASALGIAVAFVGRRRLLGDKARTERPSPEGDRA